jgi:hypothetical protein
MRFQVKERPPRPQRVAGIDKFDPPATRPPIEAVKGLHGVSIPRLRWLEQPITDEWRRVPRERRAHRRRLYK